MIKNYNPIVSLCHEDTNPDTLKNVMGSAMTFTEIFDILEESRQAKSHTVEEPQGLLPTVPIVRRQEAMLAQIADFDRQVDRAPTEPLLHQTGRFLYVHEGKGQIVIQDKVYELLPDSLVVLMPWQVSQIVEVEHPLKYDLVVFNYTYLSFILRNSFDFSNGNEELRNVLYSVNVLVPTSTNRPVFREIFASLSRLLSKTDGIHRNNHNIDLGSTILNTVKEDELCCNTHWRAVQLTAKLMELVSLYMLEAKCDVENKDIPDANRAPKTYEQTKVFQYLYTNLEANPTMRSVASQFMMSESSLNRYIRRTTGESYADLIKDMKAVKIIEYLLYSDFPLQEIATLMGYKDASYISRLVYDKTGLHATEIRNHPKRFTQLNRDKGFENARAISRYISNHFSTDLTAADVAQEFNLSVASLNRTLLDVFDRNFADLLNHMRLTKACCLLLSSNLDITEIAFQVGYNSTKTFVRNFKLVYHTTPSRFRASIQLQEDSLDNTNQQ